MEKIFEPNRLLDRLCQELKVRSDKQLARKLGLAPDVVADLRRRRVPVTATMLLTMQEVSGVPVDTLRALMGDRRRRFRVSVMRRSRSQGNFTANGSAPVRRKDPAAPSDAFGYRRRNHVHAAYVDAAIRLKETLGAASTAAFLRDEGVDDEVVGRVLDEPAEADT